MKIFISFLLLHGMLLCPNSPLTLIKIWQLWRCWFLRSYDWSKFVYDLMYSWEKILKGKTLGGAFFWVCGLFIHFCLSVIYFQHVYCVLYNNFSQVQYLDCVVFWKDILINKFPWLCLEKRGMITTFSKKKLMRTFLDWDLRFFTT